MRVRSQNMLNSAEEAGRVSAILKEDISQMGTKSWVATEFETINVYIDSANEDYSSYTLTRETNKFDNIYFEKVHYNASGVCDGIMKVNWSVRPVNNENVLFRECEWKDIAKCPNTGRDDNACPTAVEIARNVSDFKFLPSRPGAQGSPSPTPNSNIMFPPQNSNKAFALVKNLSAGTAIAFPNATATRYTLCNFTRNSLPSSGTPTQHQHTNFYIAQNIQPPPPLQPCQTFTFLSEEEYSIDFELPCIKPACANSDNSSKCYGIPEENFNPMTLFQPGSDHLSIGLRGANNGPPIEGIPDFLFYPPYDMNGQKAWHFDFSIPRDKSPLTACIGITGAFYSPAAGSLNPPKRDGHLDIQNFTLSRKMDNVYHFDRSDLNYNPVANTTPNRASVKAFELILGIDKKGEVSRSVTVIPVPNNGILPPGVT